jgi:hypothetical protein
MGVSHSLPWVSSFDKTARCADLKPCFYCVYCLYVMSEDKPNQGNQALVEWSKWISGISLFSASGCVGVLVSKGVGEKNIINIKLAIVFFLVSIVVAWLIQLAIAMQDHRTSFGDDRKPPSQVLLKSLITLEILMFLLSCFYLARWVWKFPAAKPQQETITPNNAKPDSAGLNAGNSNPGKLNSGKLTAGKPDSGKRDSGQPDLVKSNMLKREAARREAARREAARRNVAPLNKPKPDSDTLNPLKTDTGKYYQRPG